ncbi:hypothetical protein BDZ89DRAFT_1156349 [Hymenopellis radicata]|nr:hypothetical protein BDZ89DRAFT_1156349 [Hymenopellis radicata]
MSSAGYRRWSAGPDPTSRLVTSTSGVSYNVFADFDYASYTYDEDATASGTATSTWTSSSSSSSSDSSSTSGSGSSTGAIIGVVGGLFALAALGLAVFFFLKRRRRTRTLSHDDDDADGRPPMSRYGHHNHSQSVLPSRAIVMSAAAAASHEGLPAAPASSIHSDSAVDQTDLRRTRQQALQAQMRMIQNEIAGSSSERRDEEMDDLKAQIAAMREQMKTLQQSPLAQGLSDEPPPGYTPVEGGFVAPPALGKKR